MALLECLQQETELASGLDDLDHVPSIAALNEHRTALRDTLVLLRRAAVELVALMRERGVTDFSGVMSAALSSPARQPRRCDGEFRCNASACAGR